jgi:hypothetical protein
MNERPIACHKCQHVWTYTPPLERRAECPKCRFDARVCLNCKHYDPGSHRECREDQAEWVKEKDHGNFCSYFDGNPNAAARGAELDKVKGKLDQLFGGAKPEAPKAGQSLADELAKFMSKKS